MYKLSDYFQPLNFVTLLYFFISFVFLDILGTFISVRLLKIKNDGIRVINWLIGLGFFIFAWFVLSLFIAPSRTPILISVGVLLILTTPFYIKERGIVSLSKILWYNRVLFLIIAPFLPMVFVKASLPPYYADEMAYHFVPPDFLHDITVARFPGYIYLDIPRMLNLFWQYIFTLFHTYSIARLFHFTILVSSMAYAYSILKKNFNVLTAFLFVFIFFSLPQYIVLTSTLGYIDVGAYSFLLIAMISAIDFLMNPSQTSIILTFIFWSMNLGTKYTGLTNILSFALLLASIIIWKRKIYGKFFSRGLFLKLLVISLIFGGYWYVKNFIVFGNPIYPFLFSCPWGHFVTKCPQAGGFFGSWTTKITLSSLPEILNASLLSNYAAQLLFLATPVIAMFGKNKKISMISILMFTTVAVELLILKNFSGFLNRYHQHMQLYMLLGVVLLFFNSYKGKLFNFLIKLSLILLILNSTIFYFRTVFFTDSLNFTNWDEILFAVGRKDINWWIGRRFPKMINTLTWCENPPDGKITGLATFDPDIIWNDTEGLMRIFMTNCYLDNPPLMGVPIDKVLTVAKQQRMQFTIASLNKCMPDKEASLKENQTYLYRLNNILVCNSREVKPYLYYFDFKTLK